MYKKVLATINEHLNSEIAARYALGFARACRSKFYLSFIAERGNSRSSLQRAEDAAKRLFIQAEQMEVEVESVTKTGEPVKEIEKIVRHEKIDIVFLATRRKDLDRRFYLGSVARKLLLNLPCSAALVRVVHLGKIHPSKILVPIRTKMGHVEERAYFISKMAEAFHSKVFVFHATKPITKFFHGEVHLTSLEWEGRMPKEIEEFVERTKGYGVDLEAKLVPGAIARSITIEAASKRHDLIIMGASVRGLFRSFIEGRPLEEVIRETPCDLIILKPSHEN